MILIRGKHFIVKDACKIEFWQIILRNIFLQILEARRENMIAGVIERCLSISHWIAYHVYCGYNIWASHSRFWCLLSVLWCVRSLLARSPILVVTHFVILLGQWGDAMVYFHVGDAALCGRIDMAMTVFCCCSALLLSMCRKSEMWCRAVGSSDLDHKTAVHSSSIYRKQE